MWQDILVGSIFIAALVYLAIKFFPGLTGRKNSHGSCSSCQDMPQNPVTKSKSL